MGSMSQHHFRRDKLLSVIAASVKATEVVHTTRLKQMNNEQTYVKQDMKLETATLNNWPDITQKS